MIILPLIIPLIGLTLWQKNLPGIFWLCVLTVDVYTDIDLLNVVLQKEAYHISGRAWAIFMVAATFWNSLPQLVWSIVSIICFQILTFLPQMLFQLHKVYVEAILWILFWHVLYVHTCADTYLCIYCFDKAAKCCLAIARHITKNLIFTLLWDSWRRSII